MRKTEKTFTLDEVERLVKNAYEVGFCDGEEGSDDSEFRIYKNAIDFWKKNVKAWVTKEITYLV